MSVADALPNKLPYEAKVPQYAGSNVLDFERLHVKLWNQPNHTQKECRLFDKLAVWNNIWVARKNRLIWCVACHDTGIRDNWKGKFSCECPVNGYEPVRLIALTEEGEMYERRVAETPRKCRICHSPNCSFVSNGRDFYYVCDSEECQRKINEEEDERVNM